MTVFSLCYCCRMVSAVHPALLTCDHSDRYYKNILLPTNCAVMLNIYQTLFTESNDHKVTVTCWVSGSLRQINPICNPPVGFIRTIIKFSPVLFPILQFIYFQSGHWTQVLLQECTTAQCHGQQRGHRLAPCCCCCCFPQEFLPRTMLICCHLIAASLVTVINLTTLQRWNVTKYSTIQVQLWRSVFMSTILLLQYIPEKILHFLLLYIRFTVTVTVNIILYLHVTVTGAIFLHINRVFLLFKIWFYTSAFLFGEPFECRTL